MSDPMNFAVIGCGVLAQSQHIPNIAASENAVLHTCCDLSDESLDVCKNQFGALNVSKDMAATIANPQVQAICLATTERIRLDPIRMAAELGKPIYIEKPMAATLEQAKEIHKIVTDSGIRFCVGHNRRFSPAMVQGHQIFRDHMAAPKHNGWRWSREGKNQAQLPEDHVAAMSVRVNDDWYSWKGYAVAKSESDFGAMLFEMTHFTDLCNWFMQAEPDQVVALSPNQLNHGVVISYTTGEVATILMGANGTFGYPKELYEMVGGGGVVAIDHMMEIRTAGIANVQQKIPFETIDGNASGIDGWLTQRKAGCDQAVLAGDPMLQFTGEPDKGHAHAIEAFIREIRGQGPVACGVDDALMATRVAFAAIRSSVEGRVVKIEEV